MSRTYPAADGDFRFTSITERKALDVRALIVFSIELRDVTLVELAHRLYLAGRDSLQRLRINGRQVPILEDEILRVLLKAQGARGDMP